MYFHNYTAVAFGENFSLFRHEPELFNALHELFSLRIFAGVVAIGSRGLGGSARLTGFFVTIIPIEPLAVFVAVVRCIATRALGRGVGLVAVGAIVGGIHTVCLLEMDRGEEMWLGAGLTLGDVMIWSRSRRFEYSNSDSGIQYYLESREKRRASGERRNGNGVRARGSISGRAKIVRTNPLVVNVGILL